MRVADLLTRLPGDLEWLVLFRLAALRPHCDEETMREMFALPPGLSLGDWEFAVLTSAGPCVAGDRGVSGLRGGSPSMGRVHAALLAGQDLETADCVGLGSEPPRPPVLLVLRGGEASALFAAEPDPGGYELLRAVGVRYLGGETRAGGFQARYAHSLGPHLRAGARADFARTDHCNRFFFRHGVLDASLQQGLERALRSRVAEAAALASAAAGRLAERPGLPMQALLPSGARRSFGDVVPAALLLRAVPSRMLRDWVEARRQGDLWPFHSGGVATAVDSCLVMLGTGADERALRALESYACDGGYRAQSPDLPRDAGNEHWGGVDPATTFLAHALRGTVPPDLPRTGLFFANPYLVDWARSLAPGAGPDLAEELLAGRNEDFSFGGFDLALSTALAILALAALGRAGRTAALAQLRLAGFAEPSGLQPPSMPFCSTRRVDASGPAVEALRWLDPPPPLAWADGQPYAVTFYRDGHRVIGTALAALALAVECDPSVDDVRPPGGPRVARRLDWVQTGIGSFRSPSSKGPVQPSATGTS